MLLNPLVLLPILWAGFAIARETTVVPGWTLNTNLLEKYGISGYTTVLEHVDPDTDTKVALESARLMLVAETAYDDLEKLAKNHKANFKKPDLVAAVQMGAKIYLASTIVRDSIHGYWSPAAGIPDVVRTALSLCQTSKYPGIANTKPQACAEAMALYLYFAENPISGSGDEVDMKDAKVCATRIYPLPLIAGFLPRPALEWTANSGL